MWSKFLGIGYYGESEKNIISHIPIPTIMPNTHRCSIHVGYWWWECKKKRWRGECSNINSKPAVWRIMTLERKKALFALIFWKRIKGIMQELTVKISDEKKYTFWNSIWLKVRPEGLLSNALCKVWSLLRKGWLIDK